MKIDVKWDSLSTILAKRGLEDRGKVQQFIGNEVKSRCDKYVPMDTGTLKNTATVEDGGKIVEYAQPYAAKQYYDTAIGRSYDALRGGMWFERMKTAEGADIVEAAAKLAGGEGK